MQVVLYEGFRLPVLKLAAKRSCKTCDSLRKSYKHFFNQLILILARLSYIGAFQALYTLFDSIFMVRAFWESECFARHWCSFTRLSMTLIVTSLTRGESFGFVFPFFIGKHNKNVVLTLYNLILIVLCFEHDPTLQDFLFLWLFYDVPTVQFVNCAYFFCHCRFAFCRDTLF